MKKLREFRENSACFDEAFEEIDKITPLNRAHPKVLLVRWEIYRLTKKWDYALALAEGLTESAPSDPRG